MNQMFSPFARIPRSQIKTKRKKSRITKDGRTILAATGYQKFRKVMCELAGARCQDCGTGVPLWAGHVHHLFGRGGGRRDDIPRKCLWLCEVCHGKRHIPEKVVPRKPVKEAE